MAPRASNIALFPGSFDPITRGHTDLVRRALRIFDRVIIAVLNNGTKTTMFTVDERIALIKQEFNDVPDRVEAQSFSGLLVDFAKVMQATVVIRGLRAISDYDYEAQMALMNKNLYEDLETLFMIAREEYSYVSSTIVRQVSALGGNVSKIVSPAVDEALRRKYSHKKTP